MYIQAVMTVLEDYNEHCLEMMSKLLQHMDKATIITSDQMKAVSCHATVLKIRVESWSVIPSK